jgi:hypothetical protein
MRWSRVCRCDQWFGPLGRAGREKFDLDFAKGGMAMACRNALLAVLFAFVLVIPAVSVGGWRASAPRCGWGAHRFCSGNASR